MEVTVLLYFIMQYEQWIDFDRKMPGTRIYSVLSISHKCIAYVCMYRGKVGKFNGSVSEIWYSATSRNKVSGTAG